MTYDYSPSAESLLDDADLESAAPRDRECLPCYLARMLAEFGCNNRLHWAMVWREHAAPNATALHRSLQARGGYCDCEVLFNVYPDALPEDADTPAVPCRGVSRRGSTLPCRPVRVEGGRRDDLRPWRYGRVRTKGPLWARNKPDPE